MNIKGAAHDTLNGIGKMVRGINRPPRVAKPKSKNVMQETNEEYAERLTQRRARRY